MNILNLIAIISLALMALAPSYGHCADSNEMDAAQSDENRTAKNRPKWNEFDFGFMTMRSGFGLLADSANYFQDATSKKQMDLSQATVLRDARIVLKGRFMHVNRLSYTLGYMYDGPTDEWIFRQTGLMVDVPEYDGNFFIGRTKEGFSTNKIMVGYHGWTSERSAANDAFIPILADGVKWNGRGFDGRFVYNLGAFNEKITPYEAYDKNDEVFAGRAVWLPNAVTDPETILHLAVEGRYGTSKDGSLQYRSKPESFPAQSYAVDTGKFSATSSTMGGVEAYYRPGPLMFGMEYYLNQVNSGPANDPFFHGGDIFAAFLTGGNVRSYNKKGGYFEAVSPSSPVFKGGSGTWEFVLRYSTVDLEDELIDGGKFRRITPMANWHMSDNVRLEFSYGYSELDRFGTTGTTQYAQARLQMSLM